LSSPVVAAENINFKESEMAEISRGLFRMLWNSYSFFTLYANIDKWQPDELQTKNYESRKPLNILDAWIISELNSLIDQVNKGMEKYDLVRTTRLFTNFIDNLSNWYIRRSRKRFWKSENDDDKNQAYETLWVVLTTLSKLMAPFTPFLSEDIYKNLTGEESVHLVDFPASNKDIVDMELNSQMIRARKIVELGLSQRAEAKIKVRQPLQRLSYGGKKLPQEMENIIADEVNVKEVEFLGNGESVNFETVGLVLDITPELKMEGDARELVRSIQALRKKADFKVDDRITLYYSTSSDRLAAVMDQLGDLVAREVLATKVLREKIETEATEEFSVEGEAIWIGVSRS